MMNEANGYERLLSTLSAKESISDNKKVSGPAWLLGCFIVLRTVKCGLNNTLHSNTLKQLLSSLLDKDQHEHIAIIAEDYRCECTRIVNLAGTRHENKTFLRHFIMSDGSYNTSILLCNISEDAGVDIAFLVRHKYTNAIKVVALHINNQTDGSLEESLLALNPGFQYLTNAERHCFLNAIYEKRRVHALPVNRRTTTGYGTSIWSDHMKICCEHPQLGSNWFRVCLNCSQVDKQVLEYVDHLKQNNASWLSNPLRSRRKHALLANSLVRSPIVVISMQSSRYQALFGARKNKSGKDSIAILSMPKNMRYFIEFQPSDLFDASPIVCDQK
jgi:hypothetical protein